MVFWITFILQCAKMLIFALWGSGERQPWDFSENNKYLTNNNNADDDDDDYSTSTDDYNHDGNNGYGADIDDYDGNDENDNNDSTYLV